MTHDSRADFAMLMLLNVLNIYGAGNYSIDFIIKNSGKETIDIIKCIKMIIPTTKY
ncbi:hypothetical protein SDC9_43879 [bioreactor metagenome]|uniref:Uncharacterized protein n=1 Tax=bioreactor metagenome TaxID=1076179 RepID=A0A644W2C7_9ZZZZ